MTGEISDMAGAAGEVKPHKSLFISDALRDHDHHDDLRQVSVCGVVVGLDKPDLERHSNRPLVITLGQ